MKISKISKQIDVQILKYQDLRSKCSKLLTDNFPEATFSEIVNHGSNFWKLCDLKIDNDTNVPQIIMHHSIQYFNNLERAKEEMNLIPIELDRLFKFWVNQKLKIENKLQQFEKMNSNLFEVNIY